MVTLEKLKLKQERREQAIKNDIVIRAKTRQELRQERLKSIPEPMLCESSYTSHHMYSVFELEKGKFVAICTRCLKQKLVSV